MRVAGDCTLAVRASGGCTVAVGVADDYTLAVRAATDCLWQIEYLATVLGSEDS